MRKKAEFLQTPLQQTPGISLARLSVWRAESTGEMCEIPAVLEMRAAAQQQGGSCMQRVAGVAGATRPALRAASRALDV